MDFVIKPFYDLTVNELHEIYQHRSAIFVVEQNCVYQDIDGLDKIAYHLYLKDEDGIVAYLRLFCKDDYGMISRVISIKRRQGLATDLLQRAISIAKDLLGVDVLVVSAQKYAQPVYEKAGFIPTDCEYLEDGTPRVRMTLSLS